MGILKKWMNNDEDAFSSDMSTDEYYDLTPEDALNENDGRSKMILLEPRAYSESQQIADHLKMRNTVVVNLKRVTSDQAKRIVDFLAGTIYAIGGDLQKIGSGIFLCTPNNINIQGKITEETQGKDIHDNGDINIEWQKGKGPTKWHESGDDMEKFSRTLRGYDPDEVNDFLDKIIRQVEDIVRENKEKDKRIAELERMGQENERLKDQLQQYERTEATLNRAIVMAQKTSEQIKLAAHHESEILIEEAKQNANRIVNEALLRAEKTEREANLLRRNINIFKRRVKDIVEAQLDVVSEFENIDL